MADPIIINERRAMAQERLMVACAKLAEAEGVPPPQRPVRLNADAAFQSMQDMEGLADFLELVNASIAKKPRKSVSSNK